MSDSVRKLTPRRDQLRAQLDVVVDLAVEGEHVAAGAVQHRLRGPVVEVDDRETPVAEREGALDERAVAVRPAVRDHREHPLDDGGELRRLGVPEARDPAHQPGVRSAAAAGRPTKGRAWAALLTAGRMRITSLSTSARSCGGRIAGAKSLLEPEADPSETGAGRRRGAGTGSGDRRWTGYSRFSPGSGPTSKRSGVRNDQVSDFSSSIGDERRGPVHFLRAIRQHLVLVISIVVVALLAAAVIVATAQKQYVATADIAISPVSANDDTFQGFSVFHQSLDGSSVVVTAARVFDAPQIRVPARAAMGAGRHRHVGGDHAAQPVRHHRDRGDGG